MISRPPRSTRTDTLFPHTTLFLSLILRAGGAWTDARVPFGFWIEDVFGLSRNPYDKIGHFAQGFVPAIIARELLVRVFRIGSGRLVAFLAVSICLAISAAYELVEWGDRKSVV